MTDQTPFQMTDGRKVVEGNVYMLNAKGGLEPIENIKPQHLLQDEAVRKIIGYAVPLSEQITRFKEHTFDDIGALEALLAQEYDARLGGKKGNMTLMTVDGLYKVQVQVSDYIDFGPEMHTAKSLIDECLIEWSAGSGPELRGIVTDAFNTDKEGKINRSAIFMLLRQTSEDPRWMRAMDAVRDAMRVVGSKTYIRCYRRERHDAAWIPVTIDLAKA